MATVDELIAQAEKEQAGGDDVDSLIAQAEQETAAPGPEQPQERSTGQRILNAIGNIPGDAASIVKDIYHVVTSPIETIKALDALAEGAGVAIGEKFPDWAKRPTYSESLEDTAKKEAFKEVISPITKSIEDPAGVPGRVAAYAEEHPVRTAINTSLALGTAGKTAELMGAGKTASALETAAKVTSPTAPITAISKGLDKIPYVRQIKPSNWLPSVYKKAKGTTFAEEGEALEKATGIALTPAQKTGNRFLLTAEQTARDVAATADEVRAFDIKQANQAIDKVNQVLDKIGKGGKGAETVGNEVQEAVAGAVNTVKKARRAQADIDYGAVRAMAGDKPVIKLDNLKTELQSIIDDFDVPGGEPIVRQAKTMIAQVSDKKTIEKAMAIRRVYSEASRGTGNIFGDLDKAQSRRLASRLTRAVESDFDAAPTTLERGVVADPWGGNWNKKAKPPVLDQDIPVLQELKEIAAQTEAGGGLLESGRRAQSSLPSHLKNYGITRTGEGNTVELLSRALSGEPMTKHQWNKIDNLVSHHRQAMGYGTASEGIAVNTLKIGDSVKLRGQKFTIKAKEEGGFPWEDKLMLDDGAGNVKQVLGEEVLTVDPGSLMTAEQNAVAKSANLRRALMDANANYKTYSQHIDAIENSVLGKMLGKDVLDPMSGMVVKGVAPEKVASKLLSMHPSELKVAKEILAGKSPETWNSVRRYAVEQALEESMSLPPSAGMNPVLLSTSKFINKLPAQNKLEIMFTPKELQEITNIQKAMLRMGDRTTANTSKTAIVGDFLKMLTPRGATEAAARKIGLKTIANAMTTPEGRAAMMDLAKAHKAGDAARYRFLKDALITEYAVGIAESNYETIKNINGIKYGKKGEDWYAL